MDNTTTIALSRLTAQSRAMDVIATNIANADTPGFRAERVLFSDWLSKQNGTSAPGGDRSLAYTQDRATYRDQQQGSFTQTGNPLDLAIGGERLLHREDPARPAADARRQFHARRRRHRAGCLRQRAARHQRAADPARAERYRRHHRRRRHASAATTARSAGSAWSTPGDPNALKAEGARLFDANSPTAPVAAPKLVQGAVEDSNVQPVLEMTRMMDTTREFQFVTQFIQAEAERQQTAIDKLTQRAS